MKKFKDLVQSLEEKKKFKLPRGEQEVDSYMEKGAKGKKVPVVIAKKSNKFKVYVDGQELAQYRNEKTIRQKRVKPSKKTREVKRVSGPKKTIN